jgi:SAM-dependent methyltransferase
MSKDPGRLVQEGYDAMADRYAAWAASFSSPAPEWVERLVARVPEGAAVLELGCGGDNPATRTLVGRYRYTGIDLSGEQLVRARRAFPSATFVHGDATGIFFEPASFDAVVSLFMLGHVPRAEQEPLLGRILAWLRRGGWFLGTMATLDTRDEVEEDWLGVPMFFASFDADANRELLERVGFELEDARVVPFEESGHGLVRFMWVLARKPG